MDGDAAVYDKFNGDLLFKGNYLKEKRNGKGIEYKFTPRGNKIKIFEGEYINGERKKGKEYNYNENIIYEGEYLNGKRTGKAKIYDDGKLKYEGELINGIKTGKGIEYNKFKKIKYEGEFKKGKKNGSGKEYSISDETKLLFEGEYLNN